MKRLLIVAVFTAVVAVVAAGPASAQYQPMFITVTPTTIPQGGTIAVTAGYFEPGTPVEIRVESDPVVLGSLVARPDGTVTGSFVVPLSVDVGPHSVVATGARLGTGVSTSVRGSIQVVAVASNVVTPAATTTSSSGLPVTGTDPTWLVAAGAGLVLFGGLVVIGNRRRQTAN